MPLLCFKKDNLNSINQPNKAFCGIPMEGFLFLVRYFLPLITPENSPFSMPLYFTNFMAGFVSRRLAVAVGRKRFMVESSWQNVFIVDFCRII
jgi:hypothetical protein